MARLDTRQPCAGGRPADSPSAAVVGAYGVEALPGCGRHAPRSGEGETTESVGGVSVHSEHTRDGRTIYRVRWREAGRGTANRSRTFDHENDAMDFDRRVRRLKQTGDPALLADEMTLRQYV